MLMCITNLIFLSFFFCFYHSMHLHTGMLSPATVQRAGLALTRKDGSGQCDKVAGSFRLPPSLPPSPSVIPSLVSLPMARNQLILLIKIFHTAPEAQFVSACMSSVFTAQNPYPAALTIGNTFAHACLQVI